MDSAVRLEPESSSVQESQSSASVTILLQKPKRWNETHLQVARIKLIEDVTVEDLLGPEYGPADGDQEFEDIASVFCRLSREQVLDRDIREIYNLPLYGELLDFIESLSSYAVRNKPVDAYLGKVLVKSAVWALLRLETRANLGLPWRFDAPFEIPQLNVRGKLIGLGSVVAFDSTAHTSSVPLAILSVIKKPGRIGLARYEAPHAIFQAVMAYSENASLDKYDGFVICLDDMDMYVSRVQVSSAYLRCLYRRGAITEDLPFYRSKRFNVLDPDGRRGLLKLLMGLFRYLAQSPQSKITQHHIGYS